jgi:hypothetical protein
MKRGLVLLAVMLELALLTTGCRSLFSSTRSTTLSCWTNYEATESAFAKITPRQTTEQGLRNLGLHPAVSPNVQLLTYVDIIQTFMPNPGIRLEDLPAGVRECIAAQEHGKAYLVELQDIRDKRHGNLFLDIFGFKRTTHESGWRFKGLILLKDGLVVYKLSSGEPLISREDKKLKPLGPLQELDTSVTAIVGIAR